MKPTTNKINEQKVRQRQHIKETANIVLWSEITKGAGEVKIEGAGKVEIPETSSYTKKIEDLFAKEIAERTLKQVRIRPGLFRSY